MRPSTVAGIKASRGAKTAITPVVQSPPVLRRGGSEIDTARIGRKTFHSERFDKWTGVAALSQASIRVGST